MTPQLSRFISIIFHPILMPIFCFFIIVFSFPYQYIHVPPRIWNLSVGLLLFMTCIFPSIMILILRKLKIVDDLDISKQKQRIIPYILFLLFYLISYLMYRPSETPSLIVIQDYLIASVLLGATISIIICFFMNNFLKVSLHSCASANLFTICALISRSTNKDMFILILLTFLIMGLVGAARIYLRAHTTREVYIGILCGMIGQTIAFVFYHQ